ncbi:hypothetical protein Amal_02155 [Acetobacter malorum]|uniref:Uncharacterized protein n=1 Tax=Acetobacter malorum TaxID=178901 RepID=A0A177G7W7_9PROT|nr:hypothetical protein Amal_02155 [Acetobacter malorum]
MRCDDGDCAATRVIRQMGQRQAIAAHAGDEGAGRFRQAGHALQSAGRQ